MPFGGICHPVAFATRWHFTLDGIWEGDEKMDEKQVNNEESEAEPHVDSQQKEVGLLAEREQDDASFDAPTMESVDPVPLAPQVSVEADEAPEPSLEFDKAAIRARIELLVEQNTASGPGGYVEPVRIVRPEHFDAVALKRAAEAPINWAVKDTWTQRSKILLAAEPKAGKTFLVCAMALAIAGGTLMFDKIEVIEPGAVGIIAAEDDEGEIGRRFDRMCRATGQVMSNLDLHWWPGDSIRLNRPRDIEWIREQVDKYKIKLMIYDPLSRLMDGDENSKECVSGVLTPASQMVREADCSVMLVHHLGKDDPERPKTAAQRVRGSSDIRSWYTTGMFLSGQLDQGRVNLELEQRVRGRLPTDFPVRAVEIEEQSVYDLGTLKLVADIEKKEGMDGTNEQLVEGAAKSILDLAKDKSSLGLTTSEISVHLRLGRNLMNAALKKLIREEGELEWESASDVPEGKVLVVSKGGPKGPPPPRLQPDSPGNGGNGRSVPETPPEDDELALFG